MTPYPPEDGESGHGGEGQAVGAGRRDEVLLVAAPGDGREVRGRDGEGGEGGGGPGRRGLDGNLAWRALRLGGQRLQPRGRSCGPRQRLRPARVHLAVAQVDVLHGELVAATALAAVGGPRLHVADGFVEGAVAEAELVRRVAAALEVHQVVLQRREGEGRPHRRQVHEAHHDDGGNQEALGLPAVSWRKVAISAGVALMSTVHAVKHFFTHIVINIVQQREMVPIPESPRGRTTNCTQ